MAFIKTENITITGSVVSAWRGEGVCTIDDYDDHVDIRIDTYAVYIYDSGSGGYSMTDCIGYESIKVGDAEWDNANGSATAIVINADNQRALLSSKAWTVNKTHATQTVSLWMKAHTGGYVTDSEGYSSYTVSAKTSYTWTFDPNNENGGNGEPVTAVKWYDETITTLAGTRAVAPAAGYTWTGCWSVEKTSLQDVLPGQVYVKIPNADITFYAIYKRIPNPPTVMLTAFRTTTADSSEEDPFGGYIYVTVSWSVDAETDSSNHFKKMYANLSDANGNSVLDDFSSSLSPTPTTSDTSGVSSCHLNLTKTDSAYTVTVSLTDSSNNAVKVSSVINPRTSLPIDIRNKGKAVGICAMAPEDSGVILGQPAWLNGTDTSDIPITGTVQASKSTRDVGGSYNDQACSYVKFNNGLIIAWSKWKDTLSGLEATGYVYYDPTAHAGMTYPCEIQNPVWSYEIVFGDGLGWLVEINGSQSTTKGPDFYVECPRGIYSGYFDMVAMVVGWWK